MREEGNAGRGVKAMKQNPSKIHQKNVLKNGGIVFTIAQNRPDRFLILSGLKTLLVRCEAGASQREELNGIVFTTSIEGKPDYFPTKMKFEGNCFPLLDKEGD